MTLFVIKKMNKIKEIKSKLKLLKNQKIEVISNLVGIENKFNILSSDTRTVDDWINSLSIEGLNDCDKVSVKDEDGLYKSRLGDLKKRTILRKSSIKALDALDKINSEIKLTKIDLLVAKVNSTLEKEM